MAITGKHSVSVFCSLMSCQPRQIKLRALRFLCPYLHWWSDAKMVIGRSMSHNRVSGWVLVQKKIHVQYIQVFNKGQMVGLSPLVYSICILMTSVLVLLIPKLYVILIMYLWKTRYMQMILSWWHCLNLYCEKLINYVKYMLRPIMFFFII